MYKPTRLDLYIHGFVFDPLFSFECYDILFHVYQLAYRVEVPAK